MYWSAEGIIERAELDGSNRRTIADLGETWYEAVIDARGLTLDVDMNRLYFVSYHLYSLLYIDLNSRPYIVQTLIEHFWFFYGPFGIAQDDQYVYWTEHLVYGMVFRASKTAPYEDFDIALYGTYDPRGIAVKKGNFTQSEYFLKLPMNFS